MKPARAPDQPAFVLHARPFREHQWLLELLTPDLGRFSAVGREPRPETYRQLRIKVSGREALKRLDDWRYVEPVRIHEGRALLLGLYLNELCVRLLPRFQADRTFFGVYASTLLTLAQAEQRRSALRFFERRLLEMTGFGIDYRRTMDSGDPIVADQSYRFDPTLGFCRHGGGRSIPGSGILAMAEHRWSDPEALLWAEPVHRDRIDYLLEGRALVSRRWL